MTWIALAFAALGGAFVGSGYTGQDRPQKIGGVLIILISLSLNLLSQIIST